jgi:hypothetical protein
MVTLGEQCRVLWGKYYGKKAWFNADMKDTKEKHHIVVQDGQCYNKTTAFKYMVHRGHFGNPKSRVEAAFEQIPELEQALNSLATKLAKCRIELMEELSDLFLDRLEGAIERQARKGPKASWFYVDYYDTMDTKKRSAPTTSDEEMG